MQVRRSLHSKLISLGRAFHDLVAPRDHTNPTETSPLLIFVAVVLALLLAMFEVDQHSAALKSLGLLSDPYGAGLILEGS
jgi:hypothetical protein